jgi:uncharacterized membrane protein YfhO
MKYVYNFIEAALVAVLTVWALVWLNTRIISLDEWLFFPNIIAFLHNHGLSVKTVLFFVLFFLYWPSDGHHYIVRGIIEVVKFFAKIFISIGIVILAVLAAYLGWHFLVWIASIAF